MDRLTVTNARALLAEVPETYRELFTHGSLSVEIYAPGAVDEQQPHSRDEIYVIASGSGRFDLEGRIQPVETGEVLFVPAQAQHKFVDYSNDFSTWVLFYGPEGGEAG